MLMTSQPFSDGNKRISRVSYAIIMASAGIPFKAPTNQYGSRLAAM
jgi:Fic family protein